MPTDHTHTFPTLLRQNNEDSVRIFVFAHLKMQNARNFIVLHIAFCLDENLNLMVWNFVTIYALIVGFYYVLINHDDVVTGEEKVEKVYCLDNHWQVYAKFE